MFDLDVDEPDPLPSNGSPPSAAVSQHHSAPPKLPLLLDKAGKEDNIWPSPIAVRSPDTSATFSPFRTDPFTDGDGYLPGRGRKRTLFGRRSGEWSYSQDQRDEKLLERQDDSNTNTSLSPSSDEVSLRSSASSLLSTSRSRATFVEAHEYENSPAGAGPLNLEFDVAAQHAGPDPIVLSPSEGVREQLAIQMEDRLASDTSTRKITQPSLQKTPATLLQTSLSPQHKPIKDQGALVKSRSQINELAPLNEHLTASSRATSGLEADQGYLDSRLCGSTSGPDIDQAATPIRPNSKDSPNSQAHDFGTDGGILSRANQEPGEVSAWNTGVDSQNFVDPESLYRETVDRASSLENGETVRFSPGGSLSDDPGPGTIFSSNTQLLLKQHRRETEQSLEYEKQRPEERAQSPSNDAQFLPQKVERPSNVSDKFLVQSPTQDHSLVSHQPLSPDKGGSASSQAKPINEKDKGHISDTAVVHLSSLVAPAPTPPPSQPQEVIGSSLPSSSRHRVDQILDQPLPPTPSQTRSSVGDMLDFLDTGSVPQVNAGVLRSGESDMGTAHKKRESAMTGKEVKKIKSHESPRKLDDPGSIEVPDIISSWFGLRRSSRRRRLSRKAEENEVTATLSKPLTPARRHLPTAPNPSQAPTELRPTNTQANFNHTQKFDIVGRRLSLEVDEDKGERTATTGVRRDGQVAFKSTLAEYFTLSSLADLRAPSDSQGPMSVDVIATVSSPTSRPKQAQKGPRDFSVVFHIYDDSVHPKNMQVQCFRPFADSLPAADVGDVIILRDFVVRSRNRECFLTSAGSSGWHVWRFNKHVAATEQRDDSGKALAPASTNDVPQECRGPPVELSFHEHRWARRLRLWYLNAHKSSVIDQAETRHANNT